MPQRVGPGVAVGGGVRELAGAAAVEDADEHARHVGSSSVSAGGVEDRGVGRAAPAAPRPRVRLQKDLAQMLHGDVSIELRGRHAGVAEHLLHAAQVGAAGKQVRGERVTEGVGAGLAEHVGAREDLAQQVVETLARERTATRVEKELRPAASAQQLATAVAQVPPERRGRRSAHGHDALLVALAHAAHEPALDVDVALAQPKELARRAARSRTAARGPPGRAGPAGRRARPWPARPRPPRPRALAGAAAALGRAQAGGGVVGAHALAHEIGVEGAHARRAARHAGRGAVAAAAGEELLHVADGGRRRTDASPREKARRASAGRGRRRSPCWRSCRARSARSRGTPGRRGREAARDGRRRRRHGRAPRRASARPHAPARGRGGTAARAVRGGCTRAASARARTRRRA